MKNYIIKDIVHSILEIIFFYYLIIYAITSSSISSLSICLFHKFILALTLPRYKIMT